ncbi:MAG: ABC transporter ATP-binding protein [Devosia sp.]
MTALLEIDNLSIVHDGPAGTKTILSAVDLSVGEAETVGIVGESGSGKSMTAKAVMNLLPPHVTARGSIRYRGDDLLAAGERRVEQLRGRSISLLMQDPFTMLDPLVPCGAQVAEGLRLSMRGASRQALADEAVHRLEEVGIRDPDVARRYPFQLSGGMRQRVAMAAALASNPELLIADEPSTALDVTTQAEVLALLKSLQAARGMALLLITHDLRVAFSVCSRINVFYAGRVLERAPAVMLSDDPMHPYSLGLLMSEPAVDRRLAELTAIPGTVPTPDSIASSCAFASRCNWRQEACVAARPPLRAVDADRSTACIRVEAIHDEMRARRATTDRAIAVQPAQTGAIRPLLTVKSGRKEFGSRGDGTAAVVALNNIDIVIGANESVGIVGESGSGKTTLGRCVVGLETLTSGRITLDGMDTSRLDSIDQATRKKLRRTAQIVFQDPYSSLNPRHTIGGVLSETLVVNDAPRETVRRRVNELLDMVGLPHTYAKRFPRQLSGGERQRVAIARALAVDPKLLVCDEPVSALDVSVQAQILSLFRDLRERLGLSYLFITHDLAVVRQVVDRVYVMYRSEIVEAGPVGQVLDAPQHDYTRRLIRSIPGTDAMRPDHEHHSN